MVLPTISMIEELMNIGSWAKEKRSISLPPQISTKTIDINFDNPLPSNWDQRLDLEAGEIYYINKKTGEKTINDPRVYYTSETCKEEDAEDDENPPKFTISAKFLLLVGCKDCMAYMMLKEEPKVCPRCSGRVLLFNEAGSF